MQKPSRPRQQIRVSAEIGVESAVSLQGTALRALSILARRPAKREKLPMARPADRAIDVIARKPDRPKPPVHRYQPLPDRLGDQALRKLFHVCQIRSFHRNTIPAPLITRHGTAFSISGEPSVPSAA
jgi:hypothetical protein